MAHYYASHVRIILFVNLIIGGCERKRTENNDDEDDDCIFGLVYLFIKKIVMSLFFLMKRWTMTDDALIALLIVL